MGNQKKVNLGSFDLFKGFGMLITILFHMTTYRALDTPAMQIIALLARLGAGSSMFFLVVGGYSFKEKPVLKTLKKTARDFLVPYLWVFLAVAVLFPVVHHACFHWWPGALLEGAKYDLAFLFGIPGMYHPVIFGLETYETSVVYYLLAMFLGLNLLNLVLKVKNEAVQWILVGVSLFIGKLLYDWNINFFCINQGFVALLFCYIGYAFRKHDIFGAVQSHKWILVLLTVIWLAAFLTNRLGFTFIHGYERFLLDVAVIACVSSLYFILAVPLGKPEWKWLEPLKQMGVYTYWVMCIHSVDMICVPWYRWAEIMSGRPLLGFVIEFAVKMAEIAVGCYALKSLTKLKFRREMKKMAETSA